HGMPDAIPSFTSRTTTAAAITASQTRDSVMVGLEKKKARKAWSLPGLAAVDDRSNFFTCSRSVCGQRRLRRLGPEATTTCAGAAREHHRHLITGRADQVG